MLCCLGQIRSATGAGCCMHVMIQYPLGVYLSKYLGRFTNTNPNPFRSLIA